MFYKLLGIGLKLNSKMDCSQLPQLMFTVCWVIMAKLCNFALMFFSMPLLVYMVTVYISLHFAGFEEYFCMRVLSISSNGIDSRVARRKIMSNSYRFMSPTECYCSQERPLTYGSLIVLSFQDYQSFKIISVI
uniref:Uncharacterized protein n=1 Tax=Glossina brevipalpis TaxID=37001 RepID=A0A1A9WR18_9MUSC